MKLRILPWILLTALAVAAGWFARSIWNAPAPARSGPSERRILHYQSAMHPWIKSDQPGKCTICGMDLSPVFEGEAGFNTAADLVTLSTNSITVANVSTAPATRKPLIRTVRIAGTIDDDDSRHRVLSAYTDGRLDRLFVNYLGAEVQEGEPLALIYSPALLAAVREYVALSQPASGDKNHTASMLASAASRLVQLGLTPAQVAKLPATFSETNLHFEILSPMTGTVVLKDVYEGQTVSAGQRLFELADFSTMWFQADAYEQDLAWLSPGQRVEVTSPSLPGIILTNVIAFIDPNFDEATRTAKIRIELPNPLIESAPARPQRLIRHRVYADGRVEVRTPEVLTVPRSAVLDSGQPVVFVELSDGAYQPRNVTLGRRGDLDAEILSGVEAGDRVVTQGALLLDGQAQLNGLVGTLEQPDRSGSSSNRTDLLPPVSTKQLQALRIFLDLADATRESLSADSLTTFNELAPKIHQSAGELSAAFDEMPAWKLKLSELIESSHLDPAPDLPTARKEFYAFSTALVTFAKSLRQFPEFAALKLYQCPMTRNAFPGAPPRAAWLQLQAPVRNPYFGAEMLDCGTEVRP